MVSKGMVTKGMVTKGMAGTSGAVPCPCGLFGRRICLFVPHFDSTALTVSTAPSADRGAHTIARLCTKEQATCTGILLKVVH